MVELFVQKGWTNWNTLILECCKDQEWCTFVGEDCSNLEIQSYCPEKCKNMLPKDNPCLAIKRPTYIKSLLKTGCCVEENKMHRSCDCRKNVTFCKQKCDDDPNCKGYSEGTEKGTGNSTGTNCHIATTSDCNFPGCSRPYPPEPGHDGPLDPNATCGVHPNWVGCFIKQ